jgi:hypothetical protein
MQNDGIEYLGSWPGSREAEQLLEGLDLTRAAVVAARWRDGFRDFELSLGDSRQILFRDCLQVSFNRPPGPEHESWTIDGWWTDEPSPVLQALSPEARFLYQHVVLQIGEALLRVAARSLEVLNGDVMPGDADEAPT